MSVPDSPSTFEILALSSSSRRQGWGGGQWFVVAVLALTGLSWGAVAFFDHLPILIHQPRKAIMGREILFALNAYAAEHNGQYPEGATANDAFRVVIKDGYVMDETIFRSGHYIPDGNIGAPPAFTQALAAGENGWAMTKGLSNQADPATPLIFENPLVAAWPPLWDAKALGTGRAGQIWTNWTVLVGRIDGSIRAERLVHGDLPTTTLVPIKDGKNLFELAGPHEVLDVAK